MRRLDERLPVAITFVGEVAFAVACALIFVTHTPSAALPADIPSASSGVVTISVMSLFHPKQLTISPDASAALDITAGSKHFLLEQSSSARVTLSGSKMEVSIAHEPKTVRTDRLTTNIAGPFVLEVAGKLRRRYVGSLTITPHGASLQAVVTMPLETAVASIVAAESPPGAPVEALRAQAVATRSFLIARQSGHIGFDFCDTTHCQFLRSPPDEHSLAARAAMATQGLVLTWHNVTAEEDQPLAAMYARSCGGETRSLREIGGHATGYPYYAVRCAFCRRHPEMWRRFGTSAVPRTERDRLLFNRIHGWGAIPSLTSDRSGGNTGVTQLEGRGVGHGIGLCQLGAADMARRGASFDRILAHYYPNTQIRSLPAQSALAAIP